MCDILCKLHGNDKAKAYIRFTKMKRREPKLTMKINLQRKAAKMEERN